MEIHQTSELLRRLCSVVGTVSGCGLRQWCMVDNRRANRNVDLSDAGLRSHFARTFTDKDKAPIRRLRCSYERILSWAPTIIVQQIVMLCAQCRQESRDDFCSRQIRAKKYSPLKPTRLQTSQSLQQYSRTLKSPPKYTRGVHP